MLPLPVFRRLLRGSRAGRDTHCFVNSHPQLHHTAEFFGQGSGDRDISHGDDLDGNSLLPLLPKVVRFFPEGTV